MQRSGRLIAESAGARMNAGDEEGEGFSKKHPELCMDVLVKDTKCV